MVGNASKCPQMNTMKVLVHQSFEFDGFYTWPRLSVHHDITRWLGGEFWSKTEIRGFWDVRVGLASKCPQMNTMKVLVHECFEFGGFCTWPSWSVHHDIARWLGGEFLWKIEIHGFWDVMEGLASKCAQINIMKVLVHDSFEFSGFCTWPSWSVHHGIIRWLGGEFCEKLKFVAF